MLCGHCFVPENVHNYYGTLKHKYFSAFGDLLNYNYVLELKYPASRGFLVSVCSGGRSVEERTGNQLLAG